MLCIFLERIFLRNSLKKKHLNQMKNKLSMKKQQKHPLFHLRASFSETGKVTITQINAYVYSMPRIIVFKTQKDPSTKI